MRIEEVVEGVRTQWPRDIVQSPLYTPVPVKREVARTVGRDRTTVVLERDPDGDFHWGPRKETKEWRVAELQSFRGEQHHRFTLDPNQVFLLLTDTGSGPQFPFSEAKTIHNGTDAIDLRTLDVEITEKDKPEWFCPRCQTFPTDPQRHVQETRHRLMQLTGTMKPASPQPSVEKEPQEVTSP